jgi:phosphoribosylanthranilate isomerase
MIRIKICGITRLAEAEWAGASGADAIGLVFYPQSSRYVTAEKASKIIRLMPPFITPVGLFVNESLATIHQIAHQTNIQCAQLHGQETPEFCEKLEIPHIKALPVKNDACGMSQTAERYQSAQGIMADTYDPNKHGGTGRTFNWHQLDQKRLNKPVILAGGLNAENVQSAIETVRPYGVDVSSGVEKRQGVKDGDKIAQFCYKARQATK